MNFLNTALWNKLLVIIQIPDILMKVVSCAEDNIKEAPLTLPVSPQQNWVMKNNTLHSETKHGFYMLQQHEILFFWRWFF